MIAFADIGDDDDTALSAIGVLFPAADIGKLRELGARQISLSEFFGDWYDTSGGDLLLRGTWTAEDGREFADPSLRALDGVRICSGGGGTPAPGSGGQFAYAFLCPPYRLDMRPAETQKLFDEIREFLLPHQDEHRVRDWSSPRLVEVADYFEAGMEWWGVFLFTIYTPRTRRLVVIAASATD